MRPRYAPSVHRRSRRPVRLWPRTRRINHHAIDRALHVAAWGSHVCQPMQVKVSELPSASARQATRAVVDTMSPEPQRPTASEPGITINHHQEVKPA